jgi:membrane-associated protease RseP (regulator of RpoE activity)
MLVALPASYIGLVLSDVKPVHGLAGGLVLGDSLLFRGMQYLIHGSIPAGYDIFLHPVAFAGWIGMLVTMLNLLPVGQLDGGHVAYAVFGPKAIWVSRAVFLLILALSMFTWPGWLLWAALMLLVIRLRHPPVYEQFPSPLDQGRMAVAWIALVIFVATFIPSPISEMQ